MKNEEDNETFIKTKALPVFEELRKRDIYAFDDDEEEFLYVITWRRNPCAK